MTNPLVSADIEVTPQRTKELLDALQDAWSKYQTVTGIQNLPETER